MTTPSAAETPIETIEPSKLLMPFQHGAILAANVGTFAGERGCVVASLEDAHFEATVTVLLAGSASQLESFGTTLVAELALGAGAYVAAAPRRERIAQALTWLGKQEPSFAQVQQAHLAVSISMRGAGASAVVTVGAGSSDAAYGADPANAAAAGPVGWDHVRSNADLTQVIRSLESQIEALDQQIADLQIKGVAVTPDQSGGHIALLANQQQQLAYARMLAHTAVSQLSVVEQVIERRNPVAPKSLRSAALGLVLGIVHVNGVLLWRAALETRLRGRDHVAQTAEAPVLAKVPNMPEGSRPRPGNASNDVQTSLAFAPTGAPSTFMSHTRPVGSKGKSSVAATPTASPSSNDQRTLLVDADLRKSALVKEYDVREGAAGSPFGWLEDPHGLHEPARSDLSKGWDLAMIPTFAAAPSPSELQARGILTRLQSWRWEHDTTVVDHVPTLPVADTLTIAPLCIGTVLFASTETPTDGRWPVQPYLCSGSVYASWERSRRAFRRARHAAANPATASTATNTYPKAATMARHISTRARVEAVRETGIRPARTAPAMVADADANPERRLAARPSQ